MLDGPGTRTATQPGRRMGAIWGSRSRPGPACQQVLAFAILISIESFLYGTSLYHRFCKINHQLNRVVRLFRGSRSVKEHTISANILLGAAIRSISDYLRIQMALSRRNQNRVGRNAPIRFVLAQCGLRKRTFCEIKHTA